ncbi:MAG: glycerate kinase [Prolixibacteraceae bacterium]|nr:glycerate kinase [Prolixibacteraceae bacterium]
MRILVAPNSMKGSLSSFEFAEAISAGLSSVSDFEIINMPVADGGDNTAPVIARIIKADFFPCRVEDPLGREIQSGFFLNKYGTAIIDLSSASGLQLLKPEEYSALKASSYGTGQLIRASVEAGAKKIILGLGGSATVDGGMGALMALGVNFYYKDEKIVKGNGSATGQVTFIDSTEAEILLKGIEITVLTDVENPIVGKQGSAIIFGPQKGASTKEVNILDKNLSLFAGALFQTSGKDISYLKGGGAAGGIAASFSALFHADIEKGADFILELSGFFTKAELCDVIFTGEGILDNTSFSGKVTGEIIRFAEKINRPVFFICAKSNLSYEYSSSLLNTIELDCDFADNDDIIARTYNEIVRRAQGKVNLINELKNLK